MIGLEVVTVGHLRHRMDVLYGAGESDRFNPFPTPLNHCSVLASTGEDPTLAFDSLTFCCRLDGLD